MTDTPFTFEGCDSPDACRQGLAPLLAAGQDWSEVHCGRCGKQGIVRHADLVTPADNTAVADPDGVPVQPVDETEASEPEAAAGKGRNRWADVAREFEAGCAGLDGPERSGAPEHTVVEVEHMASKSTWGCYYAHRAAILDWLATVLEADRSEAT